MGLEASWRCTPHKEREHAKTKPHTHTYTTKQQASKQAASTHTRLTTTTYTRMHTAKLLLVVLGSRRLGALCGRPKKARQAKQQGSKASKTLGGGIRCVRRASLVGTGQRGQQTSTQGTRNRVGRRHQGRYVVVVVACACVCSCVCVCETGWG
ncbi:hypothetical protein PTSG_13031 [Salpingoeca rosetta]|uniref:Uncharacterized protein n=1 Tax=Salpingoeca rosetta (strain ATCC 50818 / BSB-021) TaxID=946362 RepID=F2UR37_SALR5|nr:uncharacterized protein PTSG_13031 [Salpingoeca rosetta]EGD80092.1 hypothetical protein PTSG_13031 [Salpingoeca rosetta]|eukprot:XP_004988417.1 hypothetical protein PTSG_13031 [Salpingoeca rosetta]